VCSGPGIYWAYAVRPDNLSSHLESIYLSNNETKSVMIPSFVVAVAIVSSVVPFCAAIPLRVRADQVGAPGDAIYDYVGK
jgi:hypothetical protein